MSAEGGAMAASPTVPAAYFGKIPSRGDFVRSASQPGLIQLLDRWLSQGIERMSADPRWKEVYDRGAEAHFAFFSARSPRVIAGHLVASSDASGRRFPFVIAGAVDAPEGLETLARAPLSLAPLWSRFEQSARSACAATDAADVLSRLAQTEVARQPFVNDHHALQLQALKEGQTLGSLEALLRVGTPAIDLRQALLALGLLLQPLLSITGELPQKGLRLPLPADPVLRPLVASCWLELVMPFLRRLDVEMAAFLLGGRGGEAPTLAAGFSGGSAAHLHAVFDPSAADAAFVSGTPAEWVEDFVREDHAVKKLSVHLQQPDLSLSQAMAMFNEAFLGN